MQTMKGDYIFKAAKLQAFDTPCAEDRATRLLIASLEEMNAELIVNFRLLKTTIKDDRRLMASAVQAVTPDELAKALEQMAERIRE